MSSDIDRVQAGDSLAASDEERLDLARAADARWRHLHRRDLRRQADGVRSISRCCFRTGAALQVLALLCTLSAGKLVTVPLILGLACFAVGASTFWGKQWVKRDPRFPRERVRKRRVRRRRVRRDGWSDTW